MAKSRSPGMKLLLTAVIAGVLIVPLMMVYALVWDRQSQSETAQAQITAGWGGPQTVTGPLLVIPYTATENSSETVDGATVTRERQVRRELFVSPQTQAVETAIDPDRKSYAIYESIVYEAAISGTAQFALTDDLQRLGIAREALLLDAAELRFGVSDPRGLTDGARVTANGEALALNPGGGPLATGGSGFSTPVSWAGDAPLTVRWEYGLRGSSSLGMVPRGGETSWNITSQWPHPSFTGNFLPNNREVTGEGFTASYSGITNLALGERLLSVSDHAPPADERMEGYAVGSGADPVLEAASSAVTRIALVDPVDLYSQVDRAVKYGFLFIGFTFAAFLMFDIVGGAKVASAEYLLTGVGLILFFVLLLAFAEIVGFALAYVIAAAAVIGLLTAYSAAVLGTWKRAGFIGGMLAGLYALLFVLLSMETFSLVIGAVLLFVALAGIMYATRNVEWSAIRQEDDGSAGFA
ncbi:cell envelope integrity protein CreD [Erythrobacter sp. EC-HK427]|uniref:cell envelope integrity protein CreD n=1 Tax=Erythrobacter sp. EC-HK427 TaxID=2038396 RepID=UPI001255D0E9|nr:cell envelope integrity protein CreD [Erythrobacter sp. EC-HK427]VVT14048.1 Colicin resistance protein [Erythrobacter sp. EC-HK427]